MILTCPQCSVRYLLNAQVLMPKGRRVKCSACQYIWFQEPEEDDGSGRAFEGPAEMQRIPDAVRPIPDDFVPPPVPEEPPVRGMPVTTGLAASAILFCCLAGYLLMERERVVDLWPPAALLFSTAGFEMEPPGAGLVFDRLRAVSGLDRHGKPRLKVEGKIINLTKQEVKIPQLQGTLRDAGGDDQEQWVFDPPATTMEPESEMPFTAVYDNVPDNVESVNIRMLVSAPAPRTAAEDAGNIPAHHQDAEVHPSGAEEASESHPHASSQPH